MYRGEHLDITKVTFMDKRSLAVLIDAYSEAKASRNQHLVNTMVAQLEQALDSLFPPDSDESAAPGGEY